MAISDIQQVAMGPSDDALMLRNDNTVLVWPTASQGPETINNLEEVAGIAGGISNFFAFKYDCTLLGWGKNSYGQLGDGTSKNQRHPVSSELFACLSNIAADNHTVALDSDGNVWTWGYNREGQLGDGSTISRQEPKQLNDLKNIIAVDADRHTLALKSDGTVWSWGKNNFGQLGDGTTIDRSTPVRVTGLNNVRLIAAGAMFSLAVKSDGSVWTWGRNNYGQLGNGTKENSSVPVQVLGFEGGGFLNLNVTSEATPDNNEKEAPPVYFTVNPSKGVAPLKVSFTPIYSPGFSPVAIEWDFGDGDISSLETPNHVYETPGSYIVTLTARFPGDIYRESMKQVVVKASW